MSDTSTLWLGVVTRVYPLMQTALSFILFFPFILESGCFASHLATFIDLVANPPSHRGGPPAHFLFSAELSEGF